MVKGITKSITKLKVVCITCTGINKKMKAIAKKDCEIIGEWSHSITNHLYWCATSIPSGDKELIKAKWLSLDNHIHNKHNHTGAFKKCVHKQLQKRKWM